MILHQFKMFIKAEERKLLVYHLLKNNQIGNPYVIEAFF